MTGGFGFPRADEQTADRRRTRWNSEFWSGQLSAIALILAIALLLLYSEDGYMSRHGIRVTATVAELPLGEESCVRCPLFFTLGGERYWVEEALGQRRIAERSYFPDDAVELYVDPDDTTRTFEAHAVVVSFLLGMIAIAVLAVFVIIWPVYTLRRSIPLPSPHGPA